MTTSDNCAYLDYISPAASAGGELTQLQDLAEQQAEAEAEVARIEAQLNAAREVLRDLAERQVPELMDQIGVKEFSTRSGLKIEIAETIRASIPKARTDQAFSWLRSNGHESLLKRVVSVAFGRGEDEDAERIHQQLAGANLPVEDKVSVNAQTLSAWVREKLRDGQEIPLELFGVFRQRASKITLPK